MESTVSRWDAGASNEKRRCLCDESDDGRFLHYSKLEQPGLSKMPLNGGKEERVLDQPEGGQWFNWALSRAGLYFLNPTGVEKGRLEFFDFATRRRTSIGFVEKSTHGLALAPDGKSLLYSRNESEDYHIMLGKTSRITVLRQKSGGLQNQQDTVRLRNVLHPGFVLGDSVRSYCGAHGRKVGFPHLFRRHSGLLDLSKLV
jgi:hypothetical protein